MSEKRKERKERRWGGWHFGRKIWKAKEKKRVKGEIGKGKRGLKVLTFIYFLSFFELGFFCVLQFLPPLVCLNFVCWAHQAYFRREIWKRKLRVDYSSLITSSLVFLSLFWVFNQKFFILFLFIFLVLCEEKQCCKKEGKGFVLRKKNKERKKRKNKMVVVLLYFFIFNFLLFVNFIFCFSRFYLVFWKMKKKEKCVSFLMIFLFDFKFDFVDHKFSLLFWFNLFLISVICF